MLLGRDLSFCINVPGSSSRDLVEVTISEWPPFGEFKGHDWKKRLVYYIQ